MPLRGMAYSAAGLGKVAKRLFDLRNVASDVTPDAVDWTDYTEGAGGIFGTAGGAETFSGINTTIDIYWQCVDCADGGTTYYKKNGGSWTTLNSNTNLSISNGDTLDWGYEAANIFGGFREIRIYNDSDGDAVLDNKISFFDSGGGGGP